MNNWITNAVFYQIYPLGFCGAPKENTQTQPVNRIKKVIEWIPHLKDLGINAIYFSPVFQSVFHGYDTADYRLIDYRLGTNDDFKQVCNELHKNEIRVVLDGVFNHVGRSFFAFKDLQQNGKNSKYKDWFHSVNFDGNSPYGDGFSYEGWEGHYDLVKLNLENPEVSKYLLDSVGMWIDEFDIDGIRLDAADCVDINFFRQLVSYTDKKKDNFWLMAEIIHGDYTRWANPELLDSVTNYECYKGIWSSHNDKNYFEIAYSLKRQFGEGGIYKNIYTYNFVDNHDVVRLASVLNDYNHIKNCYTLMFTMPGVPSVYYGSEWGIKGEKGKDDWVLRPCLDLGKIENADMSLQEHISKLAKIRHTHKAFLDTNYEQILVTNKQLCYKREFDGEVIYVLLNLDNTSYKFEFETDIRQFTDLLTGEECICNGKADINVQANSSVLLSNL